MALAAPIQLRFSQPRIVLAAVLGAVFVFGCFYMVVDSFVWFPARYEAGYGGRRWFSALDYETNGWFGAIFFGFCGIFFVRPWTAAIRRIGNNVSALAIVDNTLEVHRSFGLRQRGYYLDDISDFELTTEGKALSSGQRALTGIAPFGSQWVVNNSMENVCLRIFVKGQSDKLEKIHVEAQFVQGGAASLTEFFQALSSYQAAIPNIKSTCTPS